jgi:ribosomal protein S18 acetylase RimI-like enzyme
VNDTALTIRPVRATDAAAIVALAARFADVRPDWRSYDEVVAGTERTLRAAVHEAREDRAVFVAMDGTTFAGFVFVDAEIDFFTGEPHAHISEIAVVRDGIGAGRALMAAAEGWAASRGSRYVSLHVTAKNARARALYERLGYELEHSRLTKQLET